MSALASLVALITAIYACASCLDAAAEGRRLGRGIYALSVLALIAAVVGFALA